MTRCIPFSVICFLSQSGMTSDGYGRGYVSFAHFCYILYIFTSPSAENREKFVHLGRLFLPSHPVGFSLPDLTVTL